MQCAVFAIAPDRQACLDRLQQAGFRADEISLLARDAVDPDSGSAPAARAGTWLPAFGAVLAIGPLALPLHGGHGLVQPLATMGVPAYAAHRYQDALAKGIAVVAVHTDNGYEIDTVTEILRDGGCEQVSAA